MSKPPTRSKRRQAARRQRRATMLADMAVRGWEPIRMNMQFGILNASEGLLVLRRWYRGDFRADTRDNGTLTYSPIHDGWRIQCTVLSQPLEGYEVIDWMAMQRSWLMALRSAAMVRGWL